MGIFPKIGLKIKIFETTTQKTCSEVVSSCVFFPRNIEALKLDSPNGSNDICHILSHGNLRGSSPMLFSGEKYGPIRGLWRNHDGCRGGGVLLESRDNIKQGSWWVECTVCCGKDIVIVLDLASQVVILVHSYTGYTDTDWTNQGLLCFFG